MENNEVQIGINSQNIDINELENMMKLMQGNQIENLNNGMKDNNKMLEAFVLFQKFMNMNQILDKQKEMLQNEINKNENQINQINQLNNNKINIENKTNKVEIEDDKKEVKKDNILNVNEEINKENNQVIKAEKKEVIKPRIRRGESKNIEQEKKNEIKE